MIVKVTLCLVVLVAAAAAVPFPGSEQEKALYKVFLESLRSNMLPSSPVGASAATGDSACDRNMNLNSGDRISQKFYDDHICLVRGSPPKDVNAFCRDFRNLPLYQVLIVNPTQLKQLRNDLGGHQVQFYENRQHYAPVKTSLPSTMYFYTNDKYNFIECRDYKGKKLSGQYQLYVPRGTKGNPKGNYQIYHGCAPRATKPSGFGVPGQC